MDKRSISAQKVHEGYWCKNSTNPVLAGGQIEEVSLTSCIYGKRDDIPEGQIEEVSL